jgi:hypothetical protein
LEHFFRRRVTGAPDGDARAVVLLAVPDECQGIVAGRGEVADVGIDAAPVSVSHQRQAGGAMRFAIVIAVLVVTHFTPGALAMLKRSRASPMPAS